VTPTRAASCSCVSPAAIRVDLRSGAAGLTMFGKMISRTRRFVKPLSASFGLVGAVTGKSCRILQIACRSLQAALVFWA
jgi:hypothetical protein